MYRFYSTDYNYKLKINKDYPYLPSCLNDLFKYFLNVWTIETCAPRLQDKWNINNPTVGECSVTAFNIQDIFGGSVYGIKLDDGSIHCFNVIDNVIIDFTSEQFGAIKLDYTLDYPQDRLEHFKKEEKYNRYLLLKENIKKLNISTFNKEFDIKRLDESDINDILEVMNNNPIYFKYCPPSPTIETIKEDMKALPPKKEYGDKYYLGFYKENKLIAILDLIKEYPKSDICFIGFFMMNINYQGKGIGKSIITELLQSIKSYGYKEVRLGCIIDNNQAKSFWLKNGFDYTGLVDKQELYDVTVLYKKL